MQKLSQKTVLKIPLKTLETMPYGISYLYMHLPNFTHANLKIQVRIVRHYLRTKTERLHFYIKDKIIPTNSLKTD